MRLSLTLVAHASTAATRAARFPADEALDAAGARATAAFAGSLRKANLALTSPAGCARETAALLGLAATVDPALADLDMGSWSGRALADVAGSEAGALRRWTTDPTFAPPDGESVVRLLGRTRQWLLEQSGRHGRVLAVTHPAVVRAAIATVLDAPAEAFWRIDVSPLGFASLRPHGDGWALRDLGTGGAVVRGWKPTN